MRGVFTGFLKASAVAIFLLYALWSCSVPLKREPVAPDEAMSRVMFFTPFFRDDMDKGSLLLALDRNELYLERLERTTPFYYGTEAADAGRVLETMRAFRRLLIEGLSEAEMTQRIRKDFEIFRAAGRVGNTATLFTGYFEPVFEGSLSPDPTFKYPIYARPDDLIEIDLTPFREKLKGERVAGRLEGGKVVPYFTRAQIDSEGRLKGRGLEIAYLKDPVDVAFLQIQGSGRIRLQDGTELTVGYHASNGRSYRSIGRYLMDKGLIGLEKMSMQTIRRCLAEHPELVEETLNYNESYVFFRRLENGPLGNLEVPLTPGRSIALDSRLFPKAALCFISTKKPVADERGGITDWVPFSRFVLNQDTGGAIKGAGRADLFWGSGPYAELAAGNMRQEGELFFLLLRR
jgi:membrane-bound lytic murein transglycosylase A